MQAVPLGRGGPLVSRAGLGLMAMSGLLSTATAPGPGEAGPLGRFPRFQGENLRRNLGLLAALEKIARDRDVTAAQLAIAWAASRGDDIIPLIGTKRRDRLAEAAAALELRLTADDLAAIEAAVPAGQVAGDRYDAAGMASLDSERPPA
jgi:aryl-alcohol dehydrogenase-like predicted oxidoreductase